MAKKYDKNTSTEDINTVTTHLANNTDNFQLPPDLGTKEIKNI